MAVENIEGGILVGDCRGEWSASKFQCLLYSLALTLILM